MIEISLRGLRLADIHFHQAMMVDCENKQTANRLDQTLACLKSRKGPRLVRRKGEYFPQPYGMIVFLPRSKGQEADKLQKLVAVQNSELLTGASKVTNIKEEGHGQVLTMGIDSVSCKTIKVKRFAIQYRFESSRIRTQEDTKKKRKRTLPPCPPVYNSKVRQPLKVHLMTSIKMTSESHQNQREKAVW